MTLHEHETSNNSILCRDCFAPDEIDSIPKQSMFRSLIRCSVCDFVTKVRQNLVKHLKLHLRKERTSAVPPPITPINPPVDLTKEEGGRGAKGMGYKTLLEVDTEEELFRRPFTEQGGN